MWWNTTRRVQFYTGIYYVFIMGCDEYNTHTELQKRRERGGGFLTWRDRRATLFKTGKSNWATRGEARIRRGKKLDDCCPLMREINFFCRLGTAPLGTSRRLLVFTEVFRVFFFFFSRERRRKIVFHANPWVILFNVELFQKNIERFICIRHPYTFQQNFDKTPLIILSFNRRFQQNPSSTKKR